MLDVAIVGCGRIADSHLAQLKRINGCRVVAVCDREPLMAQQLANRFDVDAAFCDLTEVLTQARPDVVHITTPPQSHYNLAKLCLEHGCHVYVEKPFTLYEYEARDLIQTANANGLKITAGHDDQFGHATRRMRALIESGYLGEGPLHMESYYGYELGQTGYAAALLDSGYWVRRLPGQLLHNVISHGIARIAEFLTIESPHVIAHGFVSSFLKSTGETEMIDELRVIISDEANVTAYFTFSAQMRPSLHQFRLYGSKNGLVMDHDQDTLIKLPGRRYPSYAEKFIPAVAFAKQYTGNFFTNLRTFAANDFHMKSGMKYLIENFYSSIERDSPPPIPHREILLIARIMDNIFTQLNQQRIPAGSVASV